MATSAPTEIRLADFTGPTDYHRLAAFIAAINAASASRVRGVVGPGSLAVASASIAGTALTIKRDNVELVGTGKPTITVTGSSVTNYLFGSAGRRNISYRGLGFVGNSAADAFANGCAIAYTNNSVADISGFTVEDCEFSNFKGDYWIYVEAQGTKAIDGVSIQKNRFTSRTGNARGPSNIAINSAFVGIIGNSGAEASCVRNARVTHNRMDATYIKTGVQIFHNVQDFQVDFNQIANAGAREIGDDQGAYAIMVYESSGNGYGKRGHVGWNQLTNPRSCGIYHANRFEGTLHTGNEITGQTDTRFATLPKGGIVMNGAVRTTVQGNSISRCAAAAVWWGPGSPGVSDIRIRGNLINACLQGVFIQSAAHDARSVEVSGNNIADCTDGVFVHTFANGTLSGLSIVDNQIRSSVGSGFGVRVVTGDTTYRLVDLEISRNSIAVPAVGIRASSITAGAVSIRNNTLTGASGGIEVNGSTKAIVEGNRIGRSDGGR